MYELYFSIKQKSKLLVNKQLLTQQNSGINQGIYILLLVLVYNIMFWKEVKQVRKGEQARDEMVKDVNGQILRDGVEVRRRWAEYFEQVLNGTDVSEANINDVGNWRMPVLRNLNERAISLEEVGQPECIEYKKMNSVLRPVEEELG